MSAKKVVTTSLLFILAVGLYFGYQYFFLSNVQGRIIDAETIEPIGNVKVICEGSSTQSGDDGVFVLEGIKIGKTSIVVKNNGYKTVHTYWNVVKNDREMIVKLIPNKLIGSAIVAPYGGYAVGVQVKFEGQQVETDKNGAFAFNKVPVDKHRLTVSGEGLKNVVKEVVIKEGDNLADVSMSIKDESGIATLSPGDKIKKAILFFGDKHESQKFEDEYNQERILYGWDKAAYFATIITNLTGEIQSISIMPRSKDFDATDFQGISFKNTLREVRKKLGIPGGEYFSAPEGLCQFELQYITGGEGSLIDV